MLKFFAKPNTYFDVGTEAKIKENTLICSSDDDYVALFEGLRRGKVDQEHCKYSEFDIYILDDPEYDCTPFESPAYLRGEEHGIDVVIRQINKILDNKDDGHGVCSYEPLELLRRRLLNIVKSDKGELYGS